MYGDKIHKKVELCLESKCILVTLTNLYVSGTSGLATHIKFKIRVISCSQILCHFTGPYFWRERDLMRSIPVVRERKQLNKYNYVKKKTHLVYLATLLKQLVYGISLKLDSYPQQRAFLLVTLK